jgi:protein-tyrosine phosphatase
MAGGVARILMICTGNICRSPTMEEVFRQRALREGWKMIVDSAGIQGWHAGEPPDPRTLAAAAARGYEMGNLRARQVKMADFTDFDLILAADAGHLKELRRLCPGSMSRKVRLFLGEEDLADPYYGEAAGFEEVLDAVEGRARAWDGSLGFFRHD